MIDGEQSYRTRFRFRTAKPFNGQDSSRYFSFRGMTVRLSTAIDERPFASTGCHTGGGA